MCFKLWCLYKVNSVRFHLYLDLELSHSSDVNKKLCYMGTIVKLVFHVSMSLYVVL